jgi:hypothetical protein
MEDDDQKVRATDVLIRLRRAEEADATRRKQLRTHGKEAQDVLMHSMAQSGQRQLHNSGFVIALKENKQPLKVDGDFVKAHYRFFQNQRGRPTNDADIEEFWSSFKQLREQFGEKKVKLCIRKEKTADKLEQLVFGRPSSGAPTQPG